MINPNTNSRFVAFALNDASKSLYPWTFKTLYQMQLPRNNHLLQTATGNANYMKYNRERMGHVKLFSNIYGCITFFPFTPVESITKRRFKQNVKRYWKIAINAASMFPPFLLAPENKRWAQVAPQSLSRWAAHLFSRYREANVCTVN